MIAGWDTGKFNLSRDMLDYGMEGMETQKAISKIYKTSQVIHKHLRKHFN